MNNNQTDKSDYPEPERSEGLRVTSRNGKAENAFAPEAEAATSIYKDKGWVALPRAFKDGPLWQERREFSRAEAFIDILTEVNYTPKRVLIQGQIIDCGRGQCLYSLDNWAGRWKWDKSKVRRFFELLKKEGEVETENVGKTTRLTLCKYDSYQFPQHADDTLTTHKRHADETQKTPTKQGNKGNKENKETNNIHIDAIASSAGVVSSLDSIANDENKPVNTKPAINPPFETFWEKYAKKEGSKKKCEGLWVKLKDADRTAIMEGVEAFAQSFAGDRKQYQKYPEGFLSNRLWETDSYRQAKQTTVGNNTASPALNIPFAALCEAYGKVGGNMREAEAIWSGHDERARCIIISAAMGFVRPFQNGLKDDRYQPGVYKFLKEELWQDQHRMPILKGEKELPAVEEIGQYATLRDYQQTQYRKFLELTYAHFNKRLTVNDFINASREYDKVGKATWRTSFEGLTVEQWFGEGCKDAEYYKAAIAKQKEEEAREKLAELQQYAASQLSKLELPAPSDEQFAKAVEETGTKSVGDLTRGMYSGYSGAANRTALGKILYHLVPDQTRQQYEEAKIKHAVNNPYNELSFMEFLQPTRPLFANIGQQNTDLAA